MGAHQLAYDVEIATDVIFRCRACAAVIGFNKPGVGEPSAIALKGGGWATPENPDQWMEPCSLAQEKAEAMTTADLKVLVVAREAKGIA